MKKLIVAMAVGVWAFLFGAYAAEPAAPEKATGRLWLADTSIEPYGTIAWTGLDGKPVRGAGVTLASHITKGFALWSFAESDDTKHSSVDRFGAGLRYEGHLSKQIHGDAGIGLAYNFEQEYMFTRVPVGLTFDLLQSKRANLGIRVAYAFDISGNGKHGTADGRAFAGPVLNIKW